MNSTIQPKRPAPMRMLRVWLLGERAVRGAADIALDVAQRQVEREQRVVTRASSEAIEIEHRVDQACDAVRNALTDSRTPGVIDAQEAKVITRAVRGAALAAHDHNKTLTILS